MTTADIVKNQIAKQREKKTVQWYLENKKEEISAALPACGLTIDRFTRLALSTLANSPDLQKCDEISFMKAMMTCAQLGIEPSPVLGTCYLLPFNNKKANKMEVQFILGYKGMITLARRSGEILSMAVRPVYANDIFKIGFGMDDTLEHIPYGCREDQDFAESGAFRGVYMVCKFKDGGHLIDYMPKAEIERHRAKSLAKGFGPWVDFYEEMALKTIIRKNFKYLPSSTDIISLVENSDDTQPLPSRFPSPVETTFTEVQHAEPAVEKIIEPTVIEPVAAPIIEPEIIDPPSEDNHKLLQDVYALLESVAIAKEMTGDDLLDDLTKSKLTCMIDLEEKDEKYLLKLKFALEGMLPTEEDAA